jgi:hypothetical protein
MYILNSQNFHDLPLLQVLANTFEKIMLCHCAEVTQHKIRYCWMTAKVNMEV